MCGVGQLAETGRCLLRERPGLTEPDFRYLMHEHLRAKAQAAEQDQAISHDAGLTLATVVLDVLLALLIPWQVYRMLRWYRRAARKWAGVDEVVRALRREGHFPAELE